MKKTGYIVMASLITAGINAQQDSLKKFRISGIQADLGPAIYTEFKHRSQEDYRKQISGDPFLNDDLSTYQKQPFYMYTISFNALAGMKMYISINDRKKFHKELYIGLKYGQESGSGAYYNKTLRDTTGIYTDVKTGRRLFEISSQETSYNFSTRCQKLILPVGFNFHTDKTKRIWITYGVELAPALNFGYVFISNRRVSYKSTIVTEGDTLGSSNNYNTSPFSTDYWNTQTHETGLSGVGYGFSASLPFSVYLHPFKKVKFLKHINLLASVAPLYMYSYSKYTGVYSGVTMSMACGIRYNW